MTTLSTHDTKRGEDVRARITVLAEMPDVWDAALERLLELAPLPDPGFGTLLWQAVVGAWPASRERLHAYAEKAMREAGDRTTWTAPDAAYEDAVHAAVDAAFDDPAVRDGARRPRSTQVTGARLGNALAAKLLALTMPGVPDVYQGSELWEQSLVDPDNRRPVDFDAARRLLAELRVAADVPLTDAVDDPGRASCWSPTARCRLRRDRPELFTTYARLTAPGRRPTTCSPSTAAARSRSPPGCRSASARAAAGATPRSTCPRDAGSTCTGRSHASSPAGGLDVADAAGRLPRRAAGRRGGA